MAKGVTHDESLNAFWGDEDHLEVSRQRPFSQMIFELLSEKSPAKEEKELFELILNLSIDHGTDTPSAVEVIKAAKEGKSLSESLAAGLMQINDRHGGAVEPAMIFFYSVIKEGKNPKELVREYLDNKKLIGGFGHRIYTVDPRTKLIFEKLKELGFDTSYAQLAEEIQVEISRLKEKTLPVNIDGAIAAVLCTFGWDPKLANAVFIISRTPGLCAQYINASGK